MATLRDHIMKLASEAAGPVSPGDPKTVLPIQAAKASAPQATPSDRGEDALKAMVGGNQAAADFDPQKAEATIANQVAAVVQQNINTDPNRDLEGKMKLSESPNPDDGNLEVQVASAVGQKVVQSQGKGEVKVPPSPGDPTILKTTAQGDKPAEKLSSLMLDAAKRLRRMDELETKLARYEKLEKARSIAQTMQDKHLEPHLSYEEKVAALMQLNDLKITEEAVKIASGPLTQGMSLEPDGIGSGMTAADKFKTSLLS